MYLIIGLGNPGLGYKFTRHNAGFLAIDHIAEKHNISNFNSKFKSLITDFNFVNYKFLLAKPQTYMNLSGEAALMIKNFYKLQNSQIIVIHDDIDLKLGDVRIKVGGGHAGHNGLKSLDHLIGNDYKRIRVGIGRPESRMDVSDYVLGKFTDEELKIINKNFKTITENLVNYTKS